MTIATGNPIRISKNPERPLANNVTPWGKKRLNPSHALGLTSVRVSTFMSSPYWLARNLRVSIEPKNLADLSRYFVDFFRLVLFHVKNLLALGELVSVGSRNKRRGMAGVFLPDRLYICGCHKGYEQMTDIGMRRVLQHANVIFGRDHRRNLFGES